MIPTNEKTDEFEKLMQVKVSILTALFFARNQGGSDAVDDFFTFARKYMLKQSNSYHFENVVNSTLLCTSDSVVELLRKDASVLQSTVE